MGGIIDDCFHSDAGRKRQTHLDEAFGAKERKVDGKKIRLRGKKIINKKNKTITAINIKQKEEERYRGGCNDKTR